MIGKSYGLHISYEYSLGQWGKTLSVLLFLPSFSSSVKVSFQGHICKKCKTFTLDMTFEWYDIGPSYLICEFIVTRPFCSLQAQCHHSVFKVIFVFPQNLLHLP